MAEYKGSSIDIPNELVLTMPWQLVNSKLDFSCYTSFTTSPALNCCAFRGITGLCSKVFLGNGWPKDAFNGKREPSKEILKYMNEALVTHTVKMMKGVSGYPSLLADGLGRQKHTPLENRCLLSWTVADFIEHLIKTDLATVSCLPSIKNLAHGGGLVRVWQVEFITPGVSKLHELEDTPGSYLKISNKA